MHQVARFRGLLLVLMHISGGQPARGPEILSCRHRNTAAGSHRNVFIEDGQVVFVTKYHKGEQMSRDVKIIHRYLPYEVGELVVWYLWLALPFIERIEALVWQQKAVSDYMWPADPDGRQWTTERIKKVLQQTSEKGLGQAISVAAYREIAIAISRQWVRGETAFDEDGEGESIESQITAMDGVAADEQATHSAHVAGLIYARDVMELFGSTAVRRKRFRKISGDWHRFLEFVSARTGDTTTDSTVTGKRKRGEFEEDGSEERMRRRARLHGIDAQEELRWMMRRPITLRSVQGEAIEAIQRGDSPVVAVMPTGAGKSALFMLPAFIEPGGVSIVVVPLLGLRDDMVKRCQQFNISVKVWDGKTVVDGCSIVLVTPKLAIGEAFSTFIRQLRTRQVLDRIVIDECHVILNDQVSFRKELQGLGQLAVAETQMVLLTATLPPSEEDRLFRRMFWQRDEVRLIRGRTSRTNIAYSVVDSGDSWRARMDQLEQMVEEVLQDVQEPEGKVVVMCESLGNVEQIVKAGLFVCEGYDGNTGTPNRKEILDRFRAGEVRVIVATGAFRMGIDIPDIRLVVHVDEPRSIMDYGQASGRGGRDGRRSRAIIMRGGMKFQDELVERYMSQEGQQCRRVIIDEYLDGRADRRQCEGDEEACD